MTVHEIFRPFTDSYLHRREAFPKAREVAEYFKEFASKSAKNFTKIHCQLNDFYCKVLTESTGAPILCEEIAFKDLQSFLYYDFFGGIKKNYIPNNLCCAIERKSEQLWDGVWAVLWWNREVDEHFMLKICIFSKKYFDSGIIPWYTLVITSVAI